MPEARRRAEAQGVLTNLDLFERQVKAHAAATLQTTPMAEVGCYMGYVYTRIAVDGTVLFCCNTAIEVGHLDDGPLEQQWAGERWQAVRERVQRREFFDGCERCGKFEQNVKWGERVRAG